MKQCIVIFLLLANMGLSAQNKNSASFHVVPLGVKGGIDESNLSAYLVASTGSRDYICLDAGTIYAGIEKAIANKTFHGTVSSIQKNYIKGYFISHAHLDHVSGLIITSPDDSSKTVYALPSCMKMLQDYYFNGEAWANFGDAGKCFLQKKYHFQTLVAREEINIRNTAMQVTAFPLSHVNPYESTAFLIRHHDAYLLYLGDTGPDEIEKSTQLEKLWEAIAPLVRSGKLKGIFIEVSFPNSQPDNKLFGHLTPKWLLHEMTVLSKLTGTDALKKCPIVVTHVKPPLEKITQLKKELMEQNTLGLKFVFPTQAKAFGL
jgi:3',5'-cyclic-nucleotide phosphodiesterase